MTYNVSLLQWTVLWADRKQTSGFWQSHSMSDDEQQKHHTPQLTLQYQQQPVCFTILGYGLKW